MARTRTYATSDENHPVPTVGDAVRFNDYGLQQLFGTYRGLAHMKTLPLMVTRVGTTSMTSSVDTFRVEVDDPEINTYLLSHRCFDIVAA